jgi:hypothetical protein
VILAWAPFCFACGGTSKAADQPESRTPTEGSHRVEGDASRHGPLVLEEGRCKRETPSDDSVAFRCGGLDLVVVRLDTRPRGTEFFLAYFPPDEWHREKIVLESQTFEGATFLRDGRQLGISALWSKGEDVRLVRCFWHPGVEDGKDLCTERLAKLLVNGGVQEIAFRVVELTIAGVPLRVPDGCQRIDPHTIHCPAAELRFNESYPTCRVTPEQGHAAAVRAFSVFGKVTESRQACTVFGKPWTCDRYEVDMENQRVVSLTSASTCKEPIVQCTMVLPTPRHFPQPCDQVFSGTP